MASFKALRQLVKRLGPLGTADLARRKFVKQLRYKRMLGQRADDIATLKPHAPIAPIQEDTSIAFAREMIGGKDVIFSWPVDLDHERAWEYDPVEKKHWPKRHYTETMLHAADTPRDVKIVWEISRFAHLPALGQAALMTCDSAFEREVEARILSWIEENPFAQTINWASALEISIRLLSWTTTILLLREASFEVHKNEKIRRSIFEQARYLAADLSIDNVIPTNHLIGEAAGLFVVASLWDYPNARTHAARARIILEEEIIRQTFADGVSREASGWYHQFVTHLFDLADRVASHANEPFSDAFRQRLSRMKTYLTAITTPDGVARYGDADDGYALWLAGDMSAWKDAIFGSAPTRGELEHGLFKESGYAAFHRERSFLFVRAGEFGMGGDGSSSHAHDDFLSPILWLGGFPVVVDPGTFVYNGNVEARAQYRGWDAHNAFAIGAATGAKQKFNFGWEHVRPAATVVSETIKEGGVGLVAKLGDWPTVSRGLLLIDPAPAATATLEILDIFEERVEAYPGCEWHMHLHPRWRQKAMPPELDMAYFEDDAQNVIMINSNDGFDAWTVESYDYSPMYGVSVRAPMFRAYLREPGGIQHLRVALFTQEMLNEAFGASR